MTNTSDGLPLREPPWAFVLQKHLDKGAVYRMARHIKVKKDERDNAGGERDDVGGERR